MTRVYGLKFAGVWQWFFGTALLLAAAVQPTAASAQIPPPVPGSNLNLEPSQGSPLYPPLAPKIENPFAAIPYDSEVAKSYTDNRNALRSWLKLPCIDQADKDKVVASS